MATLHEGQLFTMGNPLLDLQAHTDLEFLKKWDLKSDDAILCGDKHVPMFAEIVEKFKVEYVAGGSTQNSARVCQWMLPKPKITTYMGSIGNDEYGQTLLKKATEAGVNAVYQKNSELKTGTCAVLLVENKRSLCAHLAAAEKFTVDHLQVPANAELLKKAQVYYIAGFFLTVCPDAIMLAAKHAAEANKIFSMNLSAAFLSQVFKKPQMDAFPYVDIIFGNDDEAAVFAKEQNLGVTETSAIALKMAALPKVNSKRKRAVIITQGCNPVILAYDGKVREFPIVPLEESKIVDTNGAGDAFVGGFLSQLIQGKDFDKCIHAGNWASRLIIQRSGCTFPDVCEYQ